MARAKAKDRWAGLESCEIESSVFLLQFELKPDDSRSRPKNTTACVEKRPHA